jgi:recombination protein RecT
MSTTAITTKEVNPVATLRTLLDKSKEQIATALPRHLTPERMIRVALTAVQRTPDLQKCDALSVVGAVVQASQLGLEPDGILGQAYLVPFWNGKTKRYEAQLQPGYRGLIALARRSGEISTFFSELVYKSDKFKVVKGDSPRLIHEPDYISEDRGDIIGAYAVVVFKDGGKDFEFMAIHELNKIRASSKAKDRDGNEYGPWVTHSEEMYRKCPIRRLAKRLPLSPEFQKAAVLDEYVDSGVAPNLISEIESAETVQIATQNRAAELADKYRPKEITEASQVGPADPPTSSGESVVGPTPGEPSTSTEQSPTMAVPPNQEHSLRRSRRPQEPEDGVRLNFGDRSSKHDDRG